MYNLQKVREGMFLKNRLVHPATLTSVLEVQFSKYKCSVQCTVHYSVQYSTVYSTVQCTVQYSVQYSIQSSVHYSIGMWGVHVLIVLKLARQLENTFHLY